MTVVIITIVILFIIVGIASFALMVITNEMFEILKKNKVDYPLILYFSMPYFKRFIKSENCPETKKKEYFKLYNRALLITSPIIIFAVLFVLVIMFMYIFKSGTITNA